MAGPARQQTVIQKIAAHINLSGYHSYSGTIFDPCCGCGQAVALLGELISQKAHQANKLDNDKEVTWIAQGVEVDQERYTQSAKLLGKHNVVHASIQDLHIEGGADIMLLNPPYDWDSQKQERMEISFIKRVANTVRRRGTLILIVKEDLFFSIRSKYRMDMKLALENAGFENLAVFRFPEPEYQAYGQVVAFASKVGSRGYIDYENMDVLGEIGVVKTAGEAFDYYRYTRYLNRTMPMRRLSISKKYEGSPEPSLIESRDLDIFTDILGAPEGNAQGLVPLAPLKTTMAGLVACSGLLNDCVIDNKVIKGTTIKQTSITPAQPREGGGKVWREIEHTPSNFFVLDLKTNEIGHISEMENGGDDYNQFMVDHAQNFVNVTKEKYPALFNPDDTIHFDELRPPKVLAGREDVRGGLPQQELVMSAALCGLEHHHVVNLVCQMGTGKTVMATGIMYRWLKQNNWLHKKTLILIPASPKDLADKWIEEIETVLADHPEVWATQITSITDVDEAFSRKGTGFLVLRENIAKASSPWITVEPMKQWFITVRPPRSADDEPKKFKRFRYICPGCSKELPHATVDMIQDNLDREHKATAQGKNAFSATGRKMIRCGSVVDSDSGEFSFHGCGEAFFTRINHQRVPKYPISRYIKKRYARQFVLIADEVHEFKAASSNRAQAAYELITSAKSVIQMTGTLFNGKATGIFYVLYRSSPPFRKLYAHNEAAKFVKDFGIMETKISQVPAYDSNNNFSGYRVVTGSPREAPGLHPALAALVLPNTVFMNKYDLAFDLAPYSEHTLFVEPDLGLLEAVNNFVKPLDEKMKSYYGQFDKDAMKRAIKIQAFLAFARSGLLDAPRTPETFLDVLVETEEEYQKWLETEGSHRHDYLPPLYPPDYLFNKEKALVRLVAREKKRRRPCLIYCNQMGKRDPSPRLVEALGRYGMKAKVMRASVKKRVEFVRNAVAEGYDAVITNHALVKVGVDIVETPTVIWYSVLRNVNSLDINQANERPHRIHQTEPVEVYYLAYNSTIQAQAAQYVAIKLGVMQKFQGDVRAGLSVLEGEADIIDDVHGETANKNVLESDVNLDDLPGLPEVDVVAVPNSRVVEYVPISYEDIHEGKLTQMSLF